MYSWTSVIRPSVIRIYLYYPAMILQYIVYCLYCLFLTTVLLKTKTKLLNICFILLSNPFYMSDNLLQIE